MYFFDEDIPPVDYERARVILLPVPYEHTTSYGKGTALGPEAVIKAGPYLEFYDEQFDCEPWRLGVYTAGAFHSDHDPEVFQQKLHDHVLSLLDDNKYVISLGGEHAVSFALYRAFHDRFSNLSVLQLDAHADLRDSYQGSKWSHASVMRRIWELNPHIVPVGIRSQCREERSFIEMHRLPVFYAHRLRSEGLGENIIGHLRENVYLTIDVDFFDPSIMPGTGTPEPGGFLWYETIDFLAMLFAKRNVVGIDIVEHSPVPGLSHPDFMVAKLVYKLLGLIFLREKSQE